jgi:hypothetical protein
MTMTPEQTELARHALGLPNREKRSYRNYYIGEHAAWEAMVAAGLARKSPRLPLSGGYIAYWLTKPAAEAALLKGERLDPEDFPEIPPNA